MLKTMTLQNSTKVIICSALLVVAVIWYVSASKDETRGVLTPDLVSDDEIPNSALMVRDSGLNKELAERFRATVSFIEKGQNERAIAELNEIIRQQPYAIEPYINLASIYAKLSNIEQASVTLKKAINVNQNTSILFQGVQKIYSAQAALAYQRALDISTESDEALSLSLHIIDTLTVDKPSTVEQDLILTNDDLRQQLNDNGVELESLRQSLAQTLKEKNELITSSISSVNDVSEVQLDKENTELLNQLEQAQSQIEALEQSNSKLKIETESKPQPGIVALQREVDLQKVMLAEINTDPVVNIASVGVIERKPGMEEPAVEESTDSVVVEPGSSSSEIKVEAPESLVVESVVVSSGELTEERFQAQQKLAAIDLVKAWARSWAAQDVDTYLSHYDDQFRPSSALSNEAWREQRKVRLTNKSFIEVEVSEFIVENQREQFAVTFSQQYKSDNVNHTVFKQLTFKKVSDDWSQAKIVKEQLISS